MRQIDFEEFWDDCEKVGRLPKLGTNQAEILLMLLQGKHPTTHQLDRILDSVSAGTRISELRALGWQIDHKPMPYQTNKGKYVSHFKYFLKNLQRHRRDPRIQKFIESQLNRS